VADVVPLRGLNRAFVAKGLLALRRRESVGQTALMDVARREKTRGPKWMWVLVILFVNLIGPVAYLIFGREE